MPDLADTDLPLSTPANYATPAQIAATREYAKALLGKKPPVQNWTQGMSDMVSSLMGANQMRMAGEQERNSALSDAGQLRTANLQSETSSAPAADKSAPATIRYNNPGAQYPGPVASKFGATGSENIAGGNKIAVFDDPVNGAAAHLALLDQKYTGMPLKAAITKWSGGNRAGEYVNKIAQATGLSPDTVLTPELMRSPQGIALARAMATHEAGRPYPLTDDQWGQAAQRAFGGSNAPVSPQGGQALPFGEEPITTPATQSGAPQAIAQALARGGGGSSGVQPGVGSALPKDPATGQPTINPAYMPHRIPITNEQITRIMASQYLPTEVKLHMLMQYQLQGQPITMSAGEGIGNYVAPGTPGQGPPIFMPSGHWGTQKIGPIERPILQVPQPFGAGVNQAPVITPSPPPGPQGQNVSPSPTTAPSQEPAAPTGGTTVGSATDAQLANSPFASAPPATPPGGPQLAALGNPALGTPPPTPEGTQAKFNPKAPPGVSQADWDAFIRLQETDVEKKGEEAKAEAAGKGYAKRYEDMTQAAQKARDEIPMLDMAAKLTDDPNFYSGFGADAYMNWKGIQAAFGQAFGNDRLKGVAAPNEIFQKIISGSILEGMKVMLQGLGQVRVAEINLLQRSNASPYNSIPANKALVEINKRAHQRLQWFNDMAQDYYSGSEVVDPLTNKVLTTANMKDGEIVARNGLDVGWDKTLRKFIQEHPFATPEETAHYEKIFEDDKKVKPTEGAGGKPTQGAAPDKAAIENEMRRRGLLPK